MSHKRVLLDHGSGGKIAHAMMRNIILPVFGNPLLEKMDDAAVFAVGSGGGESQEESRIAFSTDSYVVDPIFFPGGNIGDLAVNGTVNDVAMCGGDPKYISVALILEEGFSTSDLNVILEGMARAANKAGVEIVTGDTKVLPAGKVDKIFINTTGIGVVPKGIQLSGSQARPGDKVIVSGTIADHGITILSSREGLGLSSEIQSDSAPLNGMVQSILAGVPAGAIHVLRDPTRGGVATTLNEIALQSQVSIDIWETAIPVKPAVQGICELLGFDPLYVANEGKLLAIVAPEVVDEVLRLIKKSPFGKDAAIIGEVAALKNHSGAAQGTDGQRDQKHLPFSPSSQSSFREPYVVLKTAIGGSRIVDMLTGEQLPRIC